MNPGDDLGSLGFDQSTASQPNFMQDSSINGINPNNNASINGALGSSPIDHMAAQMNNQLGQINQMGNTMTNQMNNQYNQMNMNVNGISNMNANMNGINSNNQFSQLNSPVNTPVNGASAVNGQPRQQQQQEGLPDAQGINPAYVQSLLRKIQPGPGMTKQQRFQQLLRSGELTRTDVQILQRHQQMLRQAQAVRQRQIHERALQQHQAGKSLPGKTVPGKTVPGKTVPGKSLPGKSLPGKSLPGKSLPGKSIPGKSLPGKTVPGKTVPNSVGTPDFSPSLSHSPISRKTIPGKTIPPQIPLNMNIPVDSPLQVGSPINQSVNLLSVNSPPMNQVNQPVNMPVNLPVNQPVNIPVNKPVNQVNVNPVNQPVNIPVNVSQQQQQQQQAQQIQSQQTVPTAAQIQQLKQQEQQKRLMQQRQQQKFFGVTAEQYEKLNGQQRQLLKLQYLRRKAKTQRFYESDQELLKKYENNPPSMDFHIHEEHYRFGHNDNLIPKSDPAIKDFLKYVAKKQIPDALMEIIKDGNIPLYDGNIILRIYDHRLTNGSNTSTTVPIVQSTPSVESGAAVKSETPANAPDSKPETADKPQETSAKKFKEYRTILRLTQSALYEDFCLSTDTQMFGDSFVLTYESEILTSTTRSVNLQPISNPYLEDRSLWPTSDMALPTYDEAADKMVFKHREDAREFVESKLNSKKRALTYENYDYKPLHQDESQSNSKYEKLMMIMSKSLAHSNISSNKQAIEVPRFERLRFIENLRHQNLLKKENNLRGASNIQSPPVGFTSFGSLMGNINNQKGFSFQQKGDTASAPGSSGNADANGEDKAGSTNVAKGKGGKAANGKAAGAATAARKKTDKPKKPRKPTKKQLAAQAAAEAAAGNPDGTPVSTPAATPAEPPKKKRAPPKKKAASATPATATPSAN